MILVFIYLMIGLGRDGITGLGLLGFIG